MKASGALAGPLNGESSELPSCLSRSKTIEFHAQARDVVGCREGPWHSTHTYRADGCREPLVWTFLGKGPYSPRESEDTMATAPHDSKTCWASWRRVDPISLSPAWKKPSPSPSQSEVTYVGGGCRDRPEGGPLSAWRCFGHHSPIEGLVRGRWGRPSHPLFHLPLTRRRRSSRDPHPMFPHRPTGGMSLSPSLLMRLCGPIGGMTRLPPWGVRGWISIPQLTTTIPDTLRKITSAVKRKNRESHRMDSYFCMAPSRNIWW
jgi:hypothetical protein